MRLRETEVAPCGSSGVDELGCWVGCMSVEGQGEGGEGLGGCWIG